MPWRICNGCIIINIIIILTGTIMISLENIDKKMDVSKRVNNIKFLWFQVLHLGF